MSVLASFESREEINSSEGEWNQTMHRVGKSLGRQVHSY